MEAGFDRYRKDYAHHGLAPALRSQIAHFFRHYKDLEAGKWVDVADWVDAEEAAALIMAAIARPGA